MNRKPAPPVVVPGTRPEGVQGEREAAAHVREMFGRVAGRYDLLNHLLSFNLDKRWRKRAVARLSSILDKPDACVLDLCCGTGDVLIEMAHNSGQARILGSDFCHPMLVEAAKKVEGRGLCNPLFEADALASIEVELNVRTHQTRAPTKALPIRYGAKEMGELWFAALTNPSTSVDRSGAVSRNRSKESSSSSMTSPELRTRHRTV